MPGGTATSVQESYADQIQAAILDIAENQAGLSWYGTTVGSLPRGIDVTGFPWLSVGPGVIAGSMQGGRFIPGQIAREPGLSEPVWDFEVTGLWPFHPGDTKTYTTTRDALRLLVQVFTQYWTAENTAQSIDILSPAQNQLQFPGGYKFYAVQLTIRAAEMLPVNYD